jgi:hypothetical protein
MAESPRRVDLRLTIPAAAPFRAVAVELAEKFAEYVGAADAKALAQQIEAAIGQMERTQSGGAEIHIEMAAEGDELVVTTRAGSTTKRTTCPIAD